MKATRTIPLIQPRKMTKNKIYILLISILLASFLSACNTPAEKRGYSNIPQNYPASWERGGPGIGF